MLEVLPGGTFTGLRTQPDLCLSVTQPLSSSPIHKNHVCVFLASHFFFVRKLKGKISSFLKNLFLLLRLFEQKPTVRYLAGPFFYNRTDLVIFQSLNKKNKKQKFVTRNPGDGMGISGCGSFLCLWAVRARCSRAHVYRAMCDVPYPPGAMKIERGVVYNPTIHLGYLLEKNIHPGRHQPWPLPSHIGPPQPFSSNGRRPLPPAP